jgi:hypothetical protein
MGEAKIGLDDSARHVRCWTVGGAARSVEGGGCRNLCLKIVASLASVEMVSSPM